MNESQDFIHIDEHLIRVWNKAEQEPLEQQVDWDRMYAKAINADSVRPLWENTLFKYAAVVALIILSCVALYKPKEINMGTPKVLLTAHTESQRSKVIILEDGTKVTLNANSDLKYPEKFSGNTREVFLKGEAFFEVTSNPKKPFIVFSGRLRTQVLGTTFTVSSYSPDGASEVTVLTGKVSVKDKLSKAETRLIRGQKAVINHNEKNFSLSSVASPEDAISWMQGKIIFESTTLKEIAEKLSSYYGEKVLIKNDAIGQQRITAIFEKQSLPNILDALTKLTNSSYTFQKDAYIIN